MQIKANSNGVEFKINVTEMRHAKNTLSLLTMIGKLHSPVGALAVELDKFLSSADGDRVISVLELERKPMSEEPKKLSKERS